jgi:hypothetical protein
MSSPASVTSSIVNRDALVTWYRRNATVRECSSTTLVGDAYYGRPIALRHPIVFYGSFAAFQLQYAPEAGTGRGSIDARLETLPVRGIDPLRPRCGR